MINLCCRKGLVHCYSLKLLGGCTGLILEDEGFLLFFFGQQGTTDDPLQRKMKGYLILFVGGMGLK